MQDAVKERKKKAEEAKALGNQMMKEQDYTAALTHYDEAVKLAPNEAIYYANRYMPHH